MRVVHGSECTLPPTPLLYWQKKLFYTPHNVQGTIQELSDPWVGAVWDHDISGGAESIGHCVTIATIVQCGNS